MSKKDELENIISGNDGKINDQLDYKEVLFQQIHICQYAQVFLDNRAFAKSVLYLLSLIPNQDYDDEFRSDIKKASWLVEIPTGRYMGDMPHDRPREITETRKEYDYLLVTNAVINLLRRKNVLWRDKSVEVI